MKTSDTLLMHPESASPTRRPLLASPAAPGALNPIPAKTASGASAMSGQADEQQRLLASLHRRVAAGQIDRRTFLHLATAIGIESTCAAAWADRVMATPAVEAQAGQRIAASYDYIVI